MRAQIAALVAAALTAVGLVAVTAAPAEAAPVCPAPRGALLVGHVNGAVLEGAVVDASGRLYVTDFLGNRLLRFDRPGAAPRTVARIPGAGGLALANDGSLLIGTGANVGTVVGGDNNRGATLVKFNPRTGSLRTLVRGLPAANGIAVAKDGTIYLTNDFGSKVVKVSPNGQVNRSWARIASANGAALSADGRWLYVARTFTNAGVDRISTANPRIIQRIKTLDAFGAADGLVVDSKGRVVVPTDVNGTVWRITPGGATCALTQNLRLSSVLAYGKGGKGFSSGRLFRAGFDGNVYEIPAGFSR